MLKKNRVYCLLAWGLVFIWMALIFFFSAQPAEESKNLSIGISQVIVEFLEQITSAELQVDLLQLHFIVRKAAHFFAYFVLGILIMNAFYISNFNHFKSFIFSFLICLSYAIIDEVHQLFVPGRSGELRDVLIDGSGALVGILIYFIFSRFKLKKSLKN